jgi:hypothetical protein
MIALPVIALYFALACATVDPLPLNPGMKAPVPGQPLPRPDLPVICRQINEWAQQYPSLNP